MKTLWEHSLESISENHVVEELSQNEIEMYCDGFCAGVLAAINSTNNLPEYKETIEHIKWKMGIGIE